MNPNAMIEGNELAVMRHALLIAEQRGDDMAALFAGIGQHEAALIGSCVDDVIVAWMRGEDPTGAAITCRHCGRRIIKDGGRWIDPEATGDDVTWRETCDANDAFTAEHEPN